MSLSEFPIQYHTDIPSPSNDLISEAEERLHALSEKHKDLIGAAVAMTRPAHRTTSHIFRARIVVYMRPDNVVAVEDSDTAEGALMGALEAVERQVREHRRKLGAPWKRPDIVDTPDRAAIL